MRIGALSTRTGTSRRLLRYYEEQGLLAPRRTPNGWRDYGEENVDRVLQIRGLLDAGLPTRLIKQILPCLDGTRTIVFPDATPEMLALLERERDQITRRIDGLSRNRAAICGYLEEVRRGAARRSSSPPAATARPPAASASRPPAGRLGSSVVAVSRQASSGLASSAAAPTAASASAAPLRRSHHSPVSSATTTTPTSTQ